MPFRAAVASTAVEVEAEASRVASMVVEVEASRVASMVVEAEASRAEAFRVAGPFRVEVFPAVSAAAFRARPVEGE